MTMEGMLSLTNICIVDACKDWQDAVHVAVQPLVNGGFVTPAYIDGIIENTHKFGPYFVLAPNLALLHARPEQGVIHQQLAVCVVRKGVVFKEGDDPVSVLVTLAAENPNDHIDVMRTIATLFADPANIEAVAKAPDVQAVYDLFVRAPQ